VAYLASSGEVRVRITAKAPTPAEAAALVDPLVAEMTARLGDVVFTTEDETLEAAVMRLLVESKRRLSCAESITGGGVAERLTAAPGASEAFVGSAVVYTPDAKRAILGVREETIEGPGVVSEACAREMASGARRAFETDLAVALTGAAGPEAHDGAPPGTVWVALDADDLQHARGFRSVGHREQVRRWAEQAALDLVRRYLEGKPLPPSDRAV
jgi:nicotinamide-nucleotide amidase